MFVTHQAHLITTYMLAVACATLTEGHCAAHGENAQGISITTILHAKGNKPVLQKFTRKKKKKKRRKIHQKKKKFLFYGLMIEFLSFSSISFLNSPKPIL